MQFLQLKMFIEHTHTEIKQFNPQTLQPNQPI